MGEPKEKEVTGTDNPVTAHTNLFHFMGCIEVSYTVAKTVTASRNYNVIHRVPTRTLNQLDLVKMNEGALNQFVVDETVPKSARISQVVVKNIFHLGLMSQEAFVKDYNIAMAEKEAELVKTRQ